LPNLSAHHLDLDVPRMLEILLDVDVRDAKRGEGLRLGGEEGVDEGRGGMDDLHPPAAAPRGRLDDHRKTDFLRNPKAFLLLRNRAAAAGDGRHLDLAHRAARLDLVIRRMDSDDGPMNFTP